MILGVRVLLGSIQVGAKLHLLDGVHVGDVESIKTVDQGTSLQTGSRHGEYLIQIGQWGQGRRLVYGRDVFEDDRFYTKAPLLLALLHSQARLTLVQIERRQFNALVAEAEEDRTLVKFLAKYRAFLQLDRQEDQ